MAITKKTSEDILKRGNLKGINAALVTYKDLYEATDNIEDRLDDLEDGSLPGPLTIADTTNATSKDTGSIITEGGIGVEKDIYAGGNITATTAVITDTISEKTTATGVTVDSVLLKDNTVKTGGGAVGSAALKVNADNTGFYEVSGTQLGATVGGQLKGGFDSTGVFTDVISEQTATAGVTIDGTLIKDGGVSATTGTITAGTLVGVCQQIAAAGALSVTKVVSHISTPGAAAFTLADGTADGQLKVIDMYVDGGDATITPTNLLGYTTITLTAVGQGCILVWNNTAGKWIVIGNNGATLA